MANILHWGRNVKAKKAAQISNRKLIANVDELAHGASKKFKIRRGEFDAEALLVNFQGKLFAYVNRCPHVGISLDWVDNQFFTVDRRYLICANHGAVFEPPTGECIWGPCVGAALQKLELEIKGEKVFVRLPGETA
ncbi:MAG: Rieske (2Fe-2S) protein [Deltaproteobacteria bacterium]|nr:Rieske (2Fe-2S) protein [Deltaproteobacteria bacterium]